MHFGDREIAEDEPEALAESLLELLDLGIGGAAIGAFVIPVLDQRDRCVGVALRVVVTATNMDGSAVVASAPANTSSFAVMSASM